MYHTLSQAPPAFARGMRISVRLQASLAQSLWYLCATEGRRVEFAGFFQVGWLRLSKRSGKLIMLGMLGMRH
jgi:hypothetical protein